MAYTEEEFLEMKTVSKKKKASKRMKEPEVKRDDLIDDVLEANPDKIWFTSAWMTREVAKLGMEKHKKEFDAENSNGMNTLLNSRYRAKSGRVKIIDKDKTVTPQVFKAKRKK